MTALTSRNGPKETCTVPISFLNHLERDRGDSVRAATRLAALRAFLKFAGRRGVTALHVVGQALDVPMKRFERPMIGFLKREEIAVIGEPGASWTGQRDRLLLRILYNTGARVSELIAIKVADVVPDGGARGISTARNASSAPCRCGAPRSCRSERG